MEFIDVRKILTAFFIAVGLAHALEESKVFEWWDDGLITADEASEMLNLLEEGNQEEACLLAEAFSLEECRIDSAPVKRAKTKTVKRKRPPITPSGFVMWKGRTDSLGHLEHYRIELQVDFYRFRLRLGSQELLTYRNNGAEAHFGQVSTREIHSYIPLDTLWGTSLQYPLGNLHIAGTLDTALNTQVRLGYGRGTSADLFCWKTPEHQSYGIQGKTSWGEFSGWWQQGQNAPLIKLQLQQSEKPASLSWKFSAYFHGDSVPDQAHLSKSILANKIWSSQTVTYTDSGPWGTKISTSARVQVPLADSSGQESPATARFKLQAESGPKRLRGSAKIICLDAASNCRQDDFEGKLASTFLDILGSSPNSITLQGGVKSRLQRWEKFTSPRIESGASYSQGNFNKASLTLVFPKTSPREEIQIRAQADVGTSRFQTSLTTTFQQKRNTSMHPVHAFIQLKTFF